MPRAQKAKNVGHGFGTAPVFLAAISTILGAILFLRFGYGVAHTGILGAFLIILISHAITIPTGMAVAEIATNLERLDRRRRGTPGDYEHEQAVAEHEKAVQGKMEEYPAGNAER
ncbi:MAG: hypothetical protein JXQ83_11035 [Candidatus Glassbacteria bacterium]|nr:hypothetical protein [Candidatus Glassbacteria bacterium]